MDFNRDAHFLLASGLSLIFGLMSVLNFAHGGLFAWGAFTGVWLFNMVYISLLAYVQDKKVSFTYKSCYSP